MSGVQPPLLDLFTSFFPNVSLLVLQVAAFLEEVSAALPDDPWGSALACQQGHSAHTWCGY